MSIRIMETPKIAKVLNKNTGYELEIKESLLIEKVKKEHWTKKNYEIIECSEECAAAIKVKEEEANPVDRIMGSFPEVTKSKKAKK